MHLRKIKIISTAKSHNSNISFFSAIIIIGLLFFFFDMLNAVPDYEIEK